MDDNELSTLIHSLADIARRDRDELARSYRSKIAELERYADGLEESLHAFRSLEVNYPAVLLLPMSDEEQRQLHGELAKIEASIKHAKELYRRNTMHYRRPKYQPEDDVPF